MMRDFWMSVWDGIRSNQVTVIVVIVGIVAIAITAMILRIDLLPYIQALFGQ